MNTLDDNYTVTRVHVMRTKLIQPEEYDQLLKMSDNEVIHYLQSTEYHEDVDALDIKDLEDLEVIDRIFTHNNDRVIKKLERISSENFFRVLRDVIEKNDLWNIGVIAQAVAGGKDPLQALKTYGRSGKTITEATLAKWEDTELTKEDIQSFTAEFSKRKRAITPSTSPLRTDGYLVDEQNILRIVTSKREEIAGEKIELREGGTIPKQVLQQAIRAEDLHGALQVLSGTAYQAVFERSLEYLEEDSMVRFEEDLRREVLRKIRKVTRHHPLGVEVLIHYLALKEIEYSNLRLLIKGKRLGLDESFMREYLVV